MPDLVDRSVKQFPIIPESATPSDALAICGSDRLAVVVDRSGLPVSLALRRDLELADVRGVGSLADPAAGLPVSVLTGEAATLSELFSYNILPAFAVGARGAILVSDQQHAVGVLSLDEILRCLTDDQSTTPSKRGLFRAFTDYLLSRDPILKIDLLSGILPLCGGSRETEILVRCPQCGCLNRLAYLDPNALPACQSPHEPGHQLTLP